MRIKLSCRSSAAFGTARSLALSIAFLSALSAGAVFAGDGERHGGNREEMRQQRQEMREQRQEQRQERLRDVRAMQSMPQQQSMPPAYPQQFQQPPAPSQQQPQYDNGRRGRMSPEERRALRRQIDQASHDVYGPGR